MKLEQKKKNPDLTRSFFGAEAADVSVRFGFVRQKTDLDGFAEKNVNFSSETNLIFRNDFLNERCRSTSHCSPINFYRNLVPGKIFPMFFFTTGAATTETETKPMKLFLKLKKKKIRKSFFLLETTYLG